MTFIGITISSQMTLKFSILRNLEEFRRKFKVGKPISFTIASIVFMLDQTGIKFSSRIFYRALANHVENVICLKKEIPMLHHVLS